MGSVVKRLKAEDCSTGNYLRTSPVSLARRTKKVPVFGELVVMTVLVSVEKNIEIVVLKYRQFLPAI